MCVCVDDLWLRCEFCGLADDCQPALFVQPSSVTHNASLTAHRPKHFSVELNASPVEQNHMHLIQPGHGAGSSAL